MEILKMESRHVLQVAALEKCCFSDPWSAISVASELKNPLSLWLVAEENGDVIGYVGSQCVGSDADVMNVAVHPDFRRQHIAEQLLTELIDRLAQTGAVSLSLEVRCSNSSALALYQKLGFALAGRRPNYYRHPKEDALILKKEW